MFFSPSALSCLLREHGFKIERVEFDPMGQGLWRRLTYVERLAGRVDNVVGGLLHTQYHVVVHARKVE